MKKKTQLQTLCTLFLALSGAISLPLSVNAETITAKVSQDIASPSNSGTLSFEKGTFTIAATEGANTFTMTTATPAIKVEDGTTAHITSMKDTLITGQEGSASSSAIYVHQGSAEEDASLTISASENTRIQASQVAITTDGGKTAIFSKGNIEIEGTSPKGLPGIVRATNKGSITLTSEKDVTICSLSKDDKNALYGSGNATISVEGNNIRFSNAGVLLEDSNLSLTSANTIEMPSLTLNTPSDTGWTKEIPNDYDSSFTHLEHLEPFLPTIRMTGKHVALDTFTINGTSEVIATFDTLTASTIRSNANVHGQRVTFNVNKKMEAKDLFVDSVGIASKTSVGDGYFKVLGVGDLTVSGMLISNNIGGAIIKTKNIRVEGAKHTNPHSPHRISLLGTYYDTDTVMLGHLGKEDIVVHNVNASLMLHAANNIYLYGNVILEKGGLTLGSIAEVEPSKHNWQEVPFTTHITMRGNVKADNADILRYGTEFMGILDIAPLDTSKPLIEATNSNVTMWYGKGSKVKGDISVKKAGDYLPGIGIVPWRFEDSITYEGNISVDNARKSEIVLTDTSHFIGQIHVNKVKEPGELDGPLGLILSFVSKTPGAINDTDDGPRMESHPRAIWTINADPTKRVTSEVTKIIGKGTIDITRSDLHIDTIHLDIPRVDTLGTAYPESGITRLALVSPIASDKDRGSISVDTIVPFSDEPTLYYEGFKEVLGDKFLPHKLVVVASDYVDALKKVNRGEILPSIIKGTHIREENVATYVTYDKEIPSSLLSNTLKNMRLEDGTWVIVGDGMKASPLGNAVFTVSPARSYDALIHTALGDSYLERRGSMAHDVTSGIFARMTHVGYTKEGLYKGRIQGITVGLETGGPTKNGKYLHAIFLKREEGDFSFLSYNGSMKSKATLLSYDYTDTKKSGIYQNTSLQVGRVHTNYSVLDNNASVSASPSTRAIILGTEYGKSLPYHNLVLTPHIGVQYARLGSSAYDIKDISIYEKGTSSFITRLGVTLSHKVSDKTSLYLRGSLLREWLGRRTTLGYDEIASDAPIRKVTSYQNTWAVLGLGLHHAPTTKMRLFLDAQTMLYGGFKNAYKVHLGMRYQF